MQKKRKTFKVFITVDLKATSYQFSAISKTHLNPSFAGNVKFSLHHAFFKIYVIP